MKNILLILVLCMFITVAIAQENNALSRDYKELAEKGVAIKANDQATYHIKIPNSPSRSFAASPAEQIIGITQYDLQTNRLLGSRTYRYADGSMGAVWTRGVEASSFPDRGTGYNYYNGTEWGPMPTERIESLRIGWPSYAPWGAGGEIVVAHDFAAGELYFNTRVAKGTGDWTETKYTYTNGPAALSWARMMTAGPENMTIHILANSNGEYMGQPLACVYSRSLDGGATWEDENLMLDGMGEDYYTEISADGYVWAEPRNGVIAFMCGWAWGDLFMMKSDDDGDTWEKTVIWQHPYPLFDWDVTITDTFFAVDNSATIALDADGKAHVVFGISRVIHDEVGGTYWLYPDVDGIGYWNEDMDRFSNDLNALSPPQLGYSSTEMVVDQNYIGWTQDIDGNGTIDLNSDIFYYDQIGLSTMPTLTVDDDGSVFVLYSSTTEGYEIDVYNYKHVWARAQVDGEWGPFVDLTEEVSHIFDECIYPQLTGSSDDFLYYMYNTDVTPGVAVNTEHAYQDNNEYFASVPKSFVYPPWMIEEQENNFGTVSQNQPNPFSGTSIIKINLVESAHLILEVHNVFGQVVIQSDLGRMTAGTHAFTIDASELESGAYFYTIKSGNNSMTKRMIVN